MSTSRLRKFRKSADLTQQETAKLVGYNSQRAYSDVELGVKRPALGTALACCILFNASLHDLFPKIAEFVERDLAARARKLRSKLETARNRDAAAAYLTDVVTRLDPPDHANGG